MELLIGKVNKGNLEVIWVINQGMVVNITSAFRERHSAGAMSFERTPRSRVWRRNWYKFR